MATNSGFSKRLAIAIASSGKKKGEVARAVGLSPLSLSRYLKGDRVPHQAVVAALAQTLGVSADELLGTPKRNATHTSGVLFRENEAVYSVDAVSLAGLDADERRTVLRMLEALRSGDAEVRQHLIGQLKIIESALLSRRQQPRAEKKDAS